MKELVSIIVPVYNAEKYLSRSIEGLLNQTYDEIEIILVDDGSTDNSLEICRKYCAEYCNIRIFEKENGGVSSARNMGIDMALGKYICFVDADDCIEKEYVENLIEEIWSGVDIAICGHDKVFPNRVVNKIPKYSKRWNAKQLKYRLFMDTNFMIVCDKMYRLDILKQHQIRFKQNLKMSEDALFEMEYAIYCSTAGYVSQPLYHYMQNNESVTHTVSMKKLKTERIKFWDYYLELEKIINPKDTVLIDAYTLRKFYEAMGIIQLYTKDNEAEILIPESVKQCYQRKAFHFLFSPYVKINFKCKYIALRLGVLECFK